MARYGTIFACLLVATTLEASGDALVRLGLLERVGSARVGVLAGGAMLLFGYGIMLNLAPLPFERVVGMYIATLFLIWQIISFLTFRATPSIATLIGGTLIIAGGLIVTFGTAIGAK